MFEWSDDEKRIFEYSDGMANVFGDPLEIDLKLREALDYRWAEVCENAQPKEANGQPRAEPVILEAHKKLVNAAFRAFQLVPFDRMTGKGCTAAMAMRVYNEFIDFRDGLKKKQSESSDSTQPSLERPPGFYLEPESTPSSAGST